MQIVHHAFHSLFGIWQTPLSIVLEISGYTFTSFTPAPPSLQEEESASSSSETAPWSFRQLCIAAAKSNDDSTTSSRLLGLLVGDDLASFATYLVRTKLAVAGEGVIKIAAQGAGRAPVVTAISEADRDLLRLRSTGGTACSFVRPC